MSEADPLVVVLHGQVAGEAVQTRDGRFSFTYDPDYLDNSHTTPLSLSMPPGGTEYGAELVRPYLHGLLPDNERVLEHWGRTYGVSAGNPFALLHHVGEDCAGAVQFVPEERLGAVLRGKGGIDWLRDEDVEDILRGLERDPTAWHTGGTGQFSLAGAQAKTALYLDTESGTWGAPWGATPTSHILKPQIAGFTDHDVNEHLCLEAVNAAGLTAARSTVQTFGEERAIVVERYDRRLLGSGALARSHQEDTCQALAVMPTRKYQNEGGPSPEKIIDLLRRHVHPESDATEDVLSFVDGLAANWVLGTTDAHAKNFSVLLTARAVRLAPLYDLASALPYDDMPARKLKLAMKIGGEYRLAFIAGRHWRRLADYAGLDADKTIDRIDRLCREIPTHLAEAADVLRPTVKASDMPDRLVETVTSWAASCRSALEH